MNTAMNLLKNRIISHHIMHPALHLKITTPGQLNLKSKSSSDFSRYLFYAFFMVFLLLLNGCSQNYPKSSSQHLTTKNRPQTAKIKIKKVIFAEVPLSTSDIDIKSMRVSKTMTLKYEDGSEKTFPLKYEKLMRTGDKIGQGTFGLITDIQGNAIKEKDGSAFISKDPDGNSFISTGGKHYLITHMETRPGSIYKTELQLQNKLLKAINTAPIDFKEMRGTIINCASSKTPWNTHLGGEEDYSLNSIYADALSPYFQNCAVTKDKFTGNLDSGQKSYFCSYISSMQSYLGDHKIVKENGYNGESFTPYNYGYTVEVKINKNGTTSSAKHYVTGKYTPELGLVMPDQKTVYMTDDGDAKGFWKFVSDKKISGFSKNWQGTLYAAKVHQLSADNGGDFSMRWIKLGHASDNQIKTLIDKNMKISDIFELAKADNLNQCPVNFNKVYEDGLVECLRLKKGQALAAAFLETRKYASYLGATIEFRKEEGITYDAKNNKLYVAMSRINASMEDNYNNLESTNDIRLAENSCGGVYELEMDNQFSVNKMRALITGRPLKAGDKYAEQNFCDPETIANPDNMTYLGSDILLISEDSTRHLNNMSWAYNLKTKELTRIASLPIGAEITGVTNAIVDGEDFLFITQQHPFVDNPKNAEGKKVAAELIEQASDDELKATIGYIRGIPAGIFIE